MRVTIYNGYYVNGYVFHTKEYGEGKQTDNSGVNLKGNLDYYGVLKEVIELRYLGRKNIVLFNCDWRDAVRGIKKHDSFDLIDVKHTSRHAGDDVFILASQAQQVYMTPYPYRRADERGWWAVWKTKARSTIDIAYRSDDITTESSLEGCYQEDEMPVPPVVSSDSHPMDEMPVPPLGLEIVLPVDLPPPSPSEDEIPIIEGDAEEDDEVTEGEEDWMSEDETEEELEFCSSDSNAETGESENEENANTENEDSE